MLTLSKNWFNQTVVTNPICSDSKWTLPEEKQIITSGGRVRRKAVFHDKDGDDDDNSGLEEENDSDDEDEVEKDVMKQDSENSSDIEMVNIDYRFCKYPTCLTQLVDWLMH